jgi:hypothetical protein
MQPEQTIGIITAIRELNSSLAIKDIISIIAILLSPVIAVLVTLFWQTKNAAINQKRKVFEILMANRHAIFAEFSVRAFNMIDTVFYKDDSVRKLWHELFGMLNNQGLDNPNGWGERAKKNLELLTEMAKVLKYGNKITHLDVDRVYNPTGLYEAKERGDQISKELLRVLKSSGGLHVTPKPD